MAPRVQNDHAERLERKLLRLGEGAGNDLVGLGKRDTIHASSFVIER
jgi:hypothetical protein